MLVLYYIENVLVTTHQIFKKHNSILFQNMYIGTSSCKHKTTIEFILFIYLFKKFLFLYESRFSVWQSLKSWMGLTFLQREIDQDLKPGSEMSTQIDVINLLNIPNAPMFSDWISSEELSGWEFSDSNLFDWSQTSKHSFPHYPTKLMSHFWIQTV